MEDERNGGFEMRVERSCTGAVRVVDLRAGGVEVSLCAGDTISPEALRRLQTVLGGRAGGPPRAKRQNEGSDGWRNERS